MRDQELTLWLTSSKSRGQISEVDVCSITDKPYGVRSYGARVCVPAVTHPRGHASGGKPGDVVLKVDASNPDHVHLVCWVVQGTEREKITLIYFARLK